MYLLLHKRQNDKWEQAQIWTGDAKQHDELLRELRKENMETITIALDYTPKNAKLHTSNGITRIEKQEEENGNRTKR